MKGEQVTPRYLERHGFNYPIMVTEMEGLGLKLPPQTFSVKDVEQYVGKDCFQTTTGGSGPVYSNTGFSENRTFSKTLLRLDKFENGALPRFVET